jgi:hypothetical protein
VTDWYSPLLSTLTSSDALALQQIFRSLGQEIARLNREIQELKEVAGYNGFPQKSRLG